MIEIRTEWIPEFGKSDVLTELRLTDYKYLVTEKKLIEKKILENKIVTIGELWNFIKESKLERGTDYYSLGFCTFTHHKPWNRHKRISKHQIGSLLISFKYFSEKQFEDFSFFIRSGKEEIDETDQFYKEELPYFYNINLSKLFCDIYSDSDLRPVMFTDEVLLLAQIFQIVQSEEIII